MEENARLQIDHTLFSSAQKNLQKRGVSLTLLVRSAMSEQRCTAEHELLASSRLKITLIKHHSCRVKVRQMGWREKEDKMRSWKSNLVVSSKRQVVGLTAVREGSLQHHQTQIM